MNDITLIIHTNSCYSYLWKIIENHVENIKINKILTHNKTDINLPQNFDEYIEYDEKLNYSKRLKIILDKIKDKYTYVMFLHDVDIIINFNYYKFKIYLNMIKKNNIDRLSLMLFNGSSIIKKKNCAICDLNKELLSPSNILIPLDNSPFIFKISSFITLLETFPDETYNTFELNPDIANYCKENLKCYGIQYLPDINIKYNRWLTMSDDFLFLHITIKGKLILPFCIYMDLEDDLRNIIKKYNLNTNKIGYIEQLFILDINNPLIV